MNQSWGAPYVSVNGHPVIWMFSAKNWVHLGFPQGALLNQTPLFVSTDNKAGRAIRLTRDQELPLSEITKLFDQAIANAHAGKKVDFQAPKPDAVHLNYRPNFVSILRKISFCTSICNGRIISRKAGLSGLKAPNKIERVKSDRVKC